MIEVIYDEDKNAVKNSEKEEVVDNEKKQPRKLPKNIRQIGSPSGNKRIYIEDYVVTYLNYIARPGSTLARGAILLGEQEQTEIGDVIYISGAVDAQNIEFDMDESAFTQEAWTEIYDKVKEFFPELSVVGWFLSRMGFSTAINEKIEKMHVDNFPGKDKVLFVTDSLECDDAFYMFEHGQLVKQKGYYIYYTKNEAMQSYIVKQKGCVSEEENSEIKRKDAELIKSYRQKNKETEPQKQNPVSLVYVASAFVVLAMLAMGITVISSYDKMKEMEVSINRLELTATDGAGDSLDDEQIYLTEDLIPAMANKEETETDANILQTTQQEMDLNQEVNENNIEPEEEEGISDEIVEDGTNNTEMVDSETIGVKPALSDGAENYYIIEYGDSLMSISEKKYGTIAYAEKIAEINNIDLEDPIYEGQKLLLPDL